MIIGIDASRANLQRKTGTEWYSFYIIKYLALLDKKNKYLLYLDRSPSVELKKIIKHHPNFSIKVLDWPFNFFWTLGRFSLEMIFHSPDVLFVPAHAIPLIHPKKTITTIHDVAFAREANLYRSESAKTDTRLFKELINIFVKVITRGRYHSGSVDYLHWSTAFAIRHAKKIITVSHFTKEEVLKIYPEARSEKIIVIHNGYDRNLYKVIDNPEKISLIKKSYGINFPYFLYVGRLEKKKNIASLIEAFAIFRENNPDMTEKLVLIGSAGFGYDEMRYVIEQFNLNKEVLMPGWVDKEDMPFIFNGAQSFIFPSRHEGFGIPALEALACGVPLAVSDLKVFKEVVAEAALYFDPNDREAIARTLKEISSNENLRAELRSRGLKRVKRFSWRKCAQETLIEIKNL